jgi:hypothetical protein
VTQDHHSRMSGRRQRSRRDGGSGHSGTPAISKPARSSRSLGGLRGGQYAIVAIVNSPVECNVEGRDSRQSAAGDGSCRCGVRRQSRVGVAPSRGPTPKSKLSTG